MKIDRVRPYVLEGLRCGFHPRRIAVVGASRHPGKLGYEVVKGLRRQGYRGEILPVNPRVCEIQGIRAFPTLRAIDGPIDLAFIALPAYIVKSVIGDCAERGVKLAAIAASGFKELGNAQLQDDITIYARSHRLPLLGPNLLAIGSPHFPFCCGLTSYNAVPGRIAVISQSGATLLAAIGFSSTHTLGISFFAGLGNKADVDFSEFIAYAGQDPDTRCIALYIEGIDSEDAFLESCRAVVSRKPIVALKAGASSIGGLAATAHTASEPGSGDKHYDRLFQRAGVIRVRTLQELLDISFALAWMPPAVGPNLAVVTNGGGSGLLAADESESRGIPLQTLSSISASLHAKIAACAPRSASLLNPIDLGATATAAQYGDVISRLIASESINGVLTSICPTSTTDIREITRRLIDAAEQAKEHRKPLIVELQGGADCEAGIHYLRASGIPAYDTPERAVAAFSALQAHSALVEASPRRSLDNRARVLIGYTPPAGAIVAPVAK